ncbi:helix-turn-helix domain-containing protein [Ruania zhangjianzhongii]|uniref:helix-turn-helix domain-containing protein n=1 Tax=Ruania zhangjianzhongii TaxID=2603206 RepID=UPI0011CA323D|nr:AraC family transcriptional regulator [Ruania zhangjianzhongii]
MFTSTEEENRRLLRARDALDRDFAQPLDVPAVAALAYMSPAHFIRRFSRLFGEPPHRYLQRRRIERACAMLRDTRVTVTEVCFAVGFNSLGTFSRTFTAIIGRSPSQYRQDAVPQPVPGCFTRAWSRPSSFG